MSYRDDQKWEATVVFGDLGDPQDTAIEVEASDIFEALKKVKKLCDEGEMYDYEIVNIGIVY